MAHLDLKKPYLPVYLSSTSTDTPTLETVSAILGGSRAYLRPDEDWPTCPTCDHPLVPFIQINVSSPSTPEEFKAYIHVPSSGSMSLVQLFICRADDGGCFDEAITHATDNPAWIARIAHFEPQRPETLTMLAARVVSQNINGAGAHSTLPEHLQSELLSVHRQENTNSRREAARQTLNEENAFLPERIISRWSLGKPEMAHWELLTEDIDDDVYEEHAPVQGLKLLGFTIRGKFFCAMDKCPEGDVNCDLRDLVQLGTWTLFDDVEDLPLYTIGNTWIAQCVDHPDVLDLIMSGNW